MGKYHVFTRYLVGLLCAAAFAFSPVASAGTVSVDVSPTTGYSVTNRSTVALPPRTTSSAVATYNPTLGPLAGGGAYQTTSSTITITAIKDGASGSTTMTGRLIAGASSMKNGMKRCLTSARCNIALAVGAMGLESLLDGIGWVMEDGARPIIRQAGGVNSEAVYPSPPYYDGLSRSLPQWNAPSLCGDAFTPDGKIIVERSSGGGCFSCPVTFGAKALPLYGYGKGTFDRPYCWFGPVSDAPPINSDYANSRVGAPLSASEIKAGVDSHYSPDPSDLPFLSTGGLDFSDPDVEFEILDIPSINGSENPVITEYPDGTTSGTFSQYDFTWTGPSKQPTVNVREQTTETTYSPTGEPIGEKKTIVAGSGSPANNPPDTPTDCDFMPTVCMFLDWFTEPDTEIQQDVDFGQLIDTVDIDKAYNVGSSTAACPQPFTVNLSWVPSVEVSIQPFCDLADMLRPLLLAIASILSGMIILRT